MAFKALVRCRLSTLHFRVATRGSVAFSFLHLSPGMSVCRGCRAMSGLCRGHVGAMSGPMSADILSSYVGPCWVGTVEHCRGVTRSLIHVKDCRGKCRGCRGCRGLSQVQVSSPCSSLSLCPHKAQSPPSNTQTKVGATWQPGHCHSPTHNDTQQ